MVVGVRPEANWKIRPFQPGDAPGARRLIESVWREHFQHHPDPHVRDFIYSRLSDVDHAEAIYGDGAVFLCAIAGDEIIGTGAIRRLDDRECEMARMFVGSKHRGRGIGRAIAEGLIKYARSAGYERVRLSSNNALTVSHRLYERMGFQAVAPWDAGGQAHSRYYALRLRA